MAFTTARSSLRFGVEELYAGPTEKKTCKDMLTTCPAARLASSRAHHADADAAPDNAPHDPARDVTPVGMPHCKNACTNVHGKRRRARSNLADRTAEPKKLHARTLRAGPRAANPRQLTPADAGVADTDDSAPAAARAHDPWPDNAGSTASAASYEPLGNMLHCNNALADAAARTAARSP
jgi:hypothetical protein